MKSVGLPQRAKPEVSLGPAETRPRFKRWFYTSAALFMILISVAGFAPSIIDQSKRNAPPTPLVTAHGITAGAWLLLFLAQATLVATRRTAVHRRLGRVGPMVAIVLIVVGYLATVEFGRRGYDLTGDVIRALSRTGSPLRDPAGLIFPFADLLSFAVLAAAGLWYRHRPEIHKRLMLFAMIALAVLNVDSAMVVSLGMCSTSSGCLPG